MMNIASEEYFTNFFSLLLCFISRCFIQIADSLQRTRALQNQSFYSVDKLKDVEWNLYKFGMKRIECTPAYFAQEHNLFKSTAF